MPPRFPGNPDPGPVRSCVRGGRRCASDATGRARRNRWRSTATAGGPAAVARGVRLLFRASRTLLETCVAFVSPPAALHLSMLALGVFAEFVPPPCDDGWTSLLRLAAPSVTRIQASSLLGKWNRRKTIPIGAPLVGFAPLRRMRSGESTSRRLAATDYGAAHAVLHDFSGLLLTQPSGLLR